MNEELYFT